MRDKKREKEVRAKPIAPHQGHMSRSYDPEPRQRHQGKKMILCYPESQLATLRLSKPHIYAKGEERAIGHPQATDAPRKVTKQFGAVLINPASTMVMSAGKSKHTGQSPTPATP